MQRGARMGDHLGDLFDQKIGNNTRVERSGANQYKIGLAESSQYFRHRTNPARHKANPRNAACASGKSSSRPAIRVPSSSSASSVTFCVVDGKMRPRIASTCADTRTALEKSPVTFVSAVRKRFPKLWPASPRPTGNDIERDVQADVRPSKGQPCSCECRQEGERGIHGAGGPELPPSSVTVTTAARSEIGPTARFFSGPRRIL